MSARKPSLHKYRIPAYLLAMVLLVAVGAATVWGVRGLERNSAWVEHTYGVLAQIEATKAAFRSTEAAARGYRLSGHPAMQAEFLSSAPYAVEELVTLAAMTADNSLQRGRAETIRREALTAIEELQRLTDVQARNGTHATRDTIRLTEILQHMERIAVQVEAMRATEHQLLGERRADSDAAIVLLLAFVVSGLVLSCALLAILARSLVRENRRNQGLERDARLALVRLEEVRADGDRLSEQRRALSVYAGLLQSCQNMDEALEVTAAALQQVVPHASGRCYVSRPSRDYFETAALFGSGTISSSDLLRHSDCWALRRGQPHRVDGVNGIRCLHVDSGASLTGLAMLCVPLVAHGDTLGMLHAVAAADGGPGDHDAQLLESVAEQLSMAMANLRLRETLRVQSLRDPLTGLFNRRYLEENLQRELQRCERKGLPLSLLMIDVDHFKRFNDQHGHAAGDAVLAQVGRTLQSMVRNEDLACRYGGEEFTVVLPETDAEVAMERAEAIRAALGGSTIVHLRKTLGPVTISAGVSTYPLDGSTPEVLFEVADASLYRAKAEGRNRVVHAGAIA